MSTSPRTRCPYAPFAEALRGLADELEPHEADGAPLSATAQARMYERLLGLLRRLGEESPVVLAIEDLHWADRSTRDLLRFLAANLRGERLAILATYRADDLHRGHPLRTLLAELERGGSAERLRLRPFTRAEVAEQISAILGEPAAPAFVTEVFERTEGNAFCVEQLVATAREGGGSQLPTLLEDILHARFERLSSAAQRLLGVVAAGGPRVRAALIAAACGLRDDERDASLRDAVDHQILAVEGDAYVFRHALLREAAYAELLPGERHRVHAAYGSALAARPELAVDGASLHAELARHWHAADELEPALAASVAAAAAAERRNGYAEASVHYARALEVWPQSTVPRPRPARAAWRCSGAPPRPPTWPARARVPRRSSARRSRRSTPTSSPTWPASCTSGWAATCGRRAPARRRPWLMRRRCGSCRRSRRRAPARACWARGVRP